jgi:hypothetical protein
VGEFDGMVCLETALFGDMAPIGGLVLVVELQFTPDDPNVRRGLDADADPMANDPIDRDDDSVANDQLFAHFSTEH